MKIAAGVSNRHIFLSEADTLTLFQTLDVPRRGRLGQDSYYTYEPTVDIVGEKYTLKNVRVIGPPRPTTQVELLYGDCIKLGIEPVVRHSADIKGSAGGVLKSEWGQVRLQEGFIVAARHIHANPFEASKRGLYDGQIVSVRSGGVRGLVFHNVLVRVEEKAVWALHIDLEEGNAAGLKNKELCDIIL